MVYLLWNSVSNYLDNLILDYNYCLQCSNKAWIVLSRED